MLKVTQARSQNQIEKKLGQIEVFFFRRAHAVVKQCPRYSIQGKIDDKNDDRSIAYCFRLGRVCDVTPLGFHEGFCFAENNNLDDSTVSAAGSSP